MPIWFELLALLLVTYAIGLTVGWALWGHLPDLDPDPEIDDGGEPS